MTLITVIRPALVFFSWSYTHDFRSTGYSLVNLDQVGFRLKTGAMNSSQRLGQRSCPDLLHRILALLDLIWAE